MKLKDACREWLKTNFEINAKIDSVKVMKQNEIDKTLNQMVVRFDFNDAGGMVGDGVAFIPITTISSSKTEISDSIVKEKGAA